MKVKQLFQGIISAVMTIALIFGLTTGTAVADVQFAAPNGAVMSNSYDNFGQEIGTVLVDEDSGGKLYCNDKFGQPTTGEIWKSKCTVSETLAGSLNFSIQGYYKNANPSASTPWNCALATYDSKPNVISIQWYSILGSGQSNLVKTTIAGPGVTITGQGQCPQNGLTPFNGPTL